MNPAEVVVTKTVVRILSQVAAHLNQVVEDASKAAQTKPTIQTNQQKVILIPLTSASTKGSQKLGTATVNPRKGSQRKQKVNRTEIAVPQVLARIAIAARTKGHDDVIKKRKLKRVNMLVPAPGLDRVMGVRNSTKKLRLHNC